MTFDAEAIIVRELHKFAMSGQLFRGSKPVMWSVVEGTALAEAEVEYQDHESDTIWAKFPVIKSPDGFEGVDVVIWTTTPWTIPGNRAVSYSARQKYGLYRVTEADEGNWAKVGDRLLLATAIADDVMKQARITAYEMETGVAATELAAMTCAHPLRGLEGGYEFDVPLLDGEHVTDDAGTGFVHTAPGHGREDYDAWSEKEVELRARGIDTTIPFTVGADGVFTADAPGFEGRQVITEKGKKGDANKAVIDALVEAGSLIARGRLKHQYPHSWRSKKPVIFRNTPQWFISMEDDRDAEGLRAKALKAIDETRFVPPAGQTRLRAMIANRPDWVISRQRAWGVPIAIFAHAETGEVLRDEAVNQRIFDAFQEEGADAWFAEGAKERFLGNEFPADAYEKVDDILDVWFESGSTHAFVLEMRPDLQWPATMYLEGTDQHRGWFHSSLLESCSTRGRAPYDEVLTHGFTMAEDGRKMSKALNNQVQPQEVVAQFGADILRLWVMTCDYAEDQRIGPEIMKTNVDAYRKLRNTLRWLLGSLHHFDASARVDFADMPSLERYVLHRLAEVADVVDQGYHDYDFKKVFQAVFNFATVDLSAFYFDIRKDALYCDEPSSNRRLSSLTVLDEVYSCPDRMARTDASLHHGRSLAVAKSV